MRKGSKITIMGQNGAGKSTIFKLINKTLKPMAGKINIATWYQVVKPEDKDLSVSKYFKKYFTDDSVFNIDRDIEKVLNAVNLKVSNYDKKISAFSWWQQARLLLAAALIQNPDILLLDEPTNHINFRHLPVIAKALDEYKWWMILVSHVNEFVRQIRIDQYLDLP